MTNLDWLELNDNSVADVSSLSGLTNLTRLYLNDNLIETITGLVNNTSLATGDYVALSGNELTVNAACVDVPAIRGRGASVLYTGGCPGDTPLADPDGDGYSNQEEWHLGLFYAHWPEDHFDALYLDWIDSFWGSPLHPPVDPDDTNGLSTVSVRRGLGLGLGLRGAMPMGRRRMGASFLDIETRWLPRHIMPSILRNF